MIEERIVTPPVRTPLMEEGGHEPQAKTATRDWWLYWNQLTLRGNQNAADIDALEAADVSMRGEIQALAAKLVSGDYQWARGTADITLTTSIVPVPGLSLTLNRSGRYALRGVLDLALIGSGDAAAALLGQFTVDGAGSSGPIAVLQTATGAAAANRATVAVEWAYDAPAAGKVIGISASKTGGTGSSTCFGTNSILSATWIHP